MRVLVTGGAGFMGSDFIRMVLEEDLVDIVVNYDLLTYAGNLENLISVEDNQKYKFVQGDICDQGLLEKTIDEYKIDTIVHYAAETHVDRSIEDPNIFIKTNVIGTVTLLNVATEKGIRMHHVSTDEVFGTLTLEDKPFSEVTPYDPKSPYSASKASADHLVRAYHNTYKSQVTISNCCNNYGPNQFPEKLIPLFITNLIEGKKIPVYGDGQQRRTWIYVRDHSKGVWVILTQGEIGETYMLGTYDEMTNLKVTFTILEALGKDESMIEHVEDRKGHDRRYAVDILKIKEELGWEPEVSFKEGIQKTVEWYKENEEWWKRLELTYI